MFSSYALFLKDLPLRIMIIILFLTGFTFAATIPYQSVVAIHELGMSNQMLSLTLFLFASASLLIGVTMGIFSDMTTNHKRLFQIATFCGVTGYGLIYFFPSAWLFLLCGIALVPVNNSSNVLVFSAVRSRVNRLYPEQSSSVSTAARTVVSAAWILIPGCVGLALAGSQSMLPAWGFAGFACLCSLLLVSVFLPAADPVAAGEAKRATFFASVKQMLEWHVLIRVVAMAMIVASHRLAGVISPLILIGATGGKVTDIGFIAGGVALLEIPFMLFWGALLKRLSALQVLAIAALFFGIYLVALVFATASWQFYALMIPNACGAAAILSMPMAYFQDLLAERPGLGASLSQSTNFVSSGFTAIAFAIGASLGGYGNSAWFALALLVMGLAGLFWLETRLQRRRPI